MKFRCIRCGYSTNARFSMYDHLYNKKKLCKPLLNDVDISSKEIRNDILNICNYCEERYADKNKHDEKCERKKKYDTDKNSEEIKTMNKKLDEMLSEIKRINQVQNQMQVQNQLQTQNPQIISNINDNRTINIVVSLKDYKRFSNNEKIKIDIIDYFKNKIEEDSDDLDDFRPEMFKIVFYNENVKSNHTIFYIREEQKDHIYVYKENMLRFEEITKQDLITYIDGEFHGQIKVMIKNIFKNYDSLTPYEKKRLDEESFIKIKEELLDKCYSNSIFNKTDEESIKLIMDENRGVHEETLIEILRNGKNKLIFPKLLKKHVQNISDIYE